jgi:predicted nuclease of predicted toxin-antitoxin system
VSEQIRFHLDEQVKSVIARELRRRGIDVTTTFDSGLRTQSDEAQLAFIRSEERVIFTHDEDFLIIASRSSEHPGMAYCKQGTRSIGEIIESLVLIHEVYTPKDMVGRVEYL